MKTSELTRLAKKKGCYITRHGAEHDLWYSPITGKTVSIHRHQAKEVPTGTANKIMKELGLK